LEPYDEFHNYENHFDVDDDVQLSFYNSNWKLEDEVKTSFNPDLLNNKNDIINKNEMKN
jgi:hypothetical protein